MFTWQNTAWDFQANPPKIGILPLASIEPHGSHLPVGADLVIMTALARQVAEQLREPTYLLPTWPLGSAGHHVGEPGAVSLHFETLWAVVRDVAVSLHEHDIHHIAVLNNHGSVMTTTTVPIGNFIVKTAVRQLNYEVPGLTAIWVQPFTAARTVLAELFPTSTQELHAGAVETSILMNLEPELVGDLPPNHVPKMSSAYLNFAPFKKLAPEGVWGCPGEASREKGKRALQAVVDATTQYIERTFRQIAELKGT